MAEFAALPPIEKSVALDASALFLSTISAFCCLTLAKRSDLVRVDALLTPIYDLVDDATKREGATKLSGCAEMPPKIAGRLCIEPLEIAAPILMAKGPLDERDMLRAIARHGKSHLNLILKRPNLPQSLRALGASRIQPIALKKEDLDQRLQQIDTQPVSLTPNATEKMREDLRAMMMPAAAFAQAAPVATPLAPVAPPAHNAQSTHDSDGQSKLIRYAVQGDAGLLATKMADLLALDHARIRRMMTRSSYAEMLLCLRALYCEPATAFAICAPFFSALFFNNPAAITLFFDRAEAISAFEAQKTIASWRIVPQSAAPAGGAANMDQPSFAESGYLSSAS